MNELRALFRCLFPPKINVGDIWEWDEGGNPFVQPRRFEVLAVLRGYVRYRSIGAEPYWQNESMRLSSFAYCHRRVMASTPADSELQGAAK